LPELPDVEGFRRVLARHTGAGFIREVVVRDKGVLRGTDPRKLQRALRGRRFLRPQRHGKWLIARTDGRAILVFHFGMTGSLLWRRAGEPEERFDHVVFVIDGGELRYNDMRKLHGLWLLREETELQRILDRLGPDALQISKQSFDQRLARRGRLKAVLADQSVIAGLGNLLVDEICWRARLNPMRPAGRLTAEERRRLYGQMRRVLRASVPTGRVPPRPSWLTGRRDKRGAACPRCAAKLSRRRIAGRATVWCPRCQPQRVVSAKRRRSS
jgi:formamidopyrimidine-DNA glycosylase